MDNYELKIKVTTGNCWDDYASTTKKEVTDTLDNIIKNIKSLLSYYDIAFNETILIEQNQHFKKDDGCEGVYIDFIIHRK